MLTPYRSKVAFVLALDPLQKQGFGHSLFFDSLQKQSYSYLNLLICWPTAEARSHLFLALDPLQKQGLGHSLFFDSLQKQSHNYLNLLICWPPAEARSHLFLALDSLQKQGLGLSLLFDSLQKQSHNYSSESSAEARSPHFFSIRNVTRTKSVSLSLLNFYFDNMIFSKIFILSCKT